MHADLTCMHGGSPATAKRSSTRKEHSISRSDVTSGGKVSTRRGSNVEKAGQKWSGS